MHGATGLGWVLVALFVAGCEGVAGVKDVRYEPADATTSETGPAETGPAETGPQETGPSETGDADVGEVPPDPCPTDVKGSKLVNIPDGKGGTFCIDATEVTGPQYQVFVASATKPAPPTRCPGTTIAAPDKGYAAEGFPQNRIRWCEAQMYCAWAGKRLCTTAEWVWTCTQGEKSTYPYGNSYVPGACVDSTDAASKVGTPGCHGTAAPFDAVFDLSGNIDEWVDACDDAATPPTCEVRGGAFFDKPSAPKNYLVCAEPFQHDDSLDEIGIRCCADAR